MAHPLTDVQTRISCPEGDRRNKQKGSSRSLRRMKMLDSYLDRLLRCEAAVTQSTEVTQFFMPKEQELHPGYTKNRLATSPQHPLCVVCWQTTREVPKS